jgi:hypothetical protein
LTTVQGSGTLLRMSCRLALASLPLLLACGPVATGSAPPLEPEDFILAGVPLDADSGEIRMSFGDPDSAFATRHPYDAAATIVSWYFRDFIVRYDDVPHPSSFVLTTREESTVRGIRVGDRSDRVLRLYGAPTYRNDPVWSYSEALEDGGQNVIEFLIEADTVARIHLGRQQR